MSRTERGWARKNNINPAVAYNLAEHARALARFRGLWRLSARGRVRAALLPFSIEYLSSYFYNPSMTYKHPRDRGQPVDEAHFSNYVHGPWIEKARALAADKTKTVREIRFAVIPDELLIEWDEKGAPE